MNYQKWIAQKRWEFINNVNKKRDRTRIEKISTELLAQDQLREFYFQLSENDLKIIWNNGDNELPEIDKEIVRIALRNKLGI